MASGPGAVIGQAPAQFSGHAFATPEVDPVRRGWRASALRPVKSLRKSMDGLAAMAGAGGDLGCQSAGVTECEHLEAVGDLKRQELAWLGPEFVADGLVEVDADHTGIIGNLIQVLGVNGSRHLKASIGPRRDGFSARRTGGGA
jgi:hypothetical protein